MATALSWSAGLDHPVPGEPTASPRPQFIDGLMHINIASSEAASPQQVPPASALTGRQRANSASAHGAGRVARREPCPAGLSVQRRVGWLPFTLGTPGRAAGPHPGRPGEPAARKHHERERRRAAGRLGARRRIRRRAAAQHRLHQRERHRRWRERGRCRRQRLQDRRKRLCVGAGALALAPRTPFRRPAHQPADPRPDAARRTLRRTA